MIINMIGGGGGAGLNFKVVGGTSAPSQPSENTIWVNTDTSITSWVFSETQPTGAAGMLWFSVGAAKDSTAPFNALKKNVAMLYPVSAKQYVSGQWVDKTVKTYQGGKWVDWWVWDGELYINGKDYTDVTGGWSVGNIPPSGWSSSQVKSVTLKFNATNMSFGGGLNNIWSGKMIDLTNYTKLVWKGSASGYSLIDVTSKKASSYDSSDVASANISGKSTATIDISKATGNYYISLRTMNSDSSITIQELYME